MTGSYETDKITNHVILADVMVSTASGWGKEAVCITKGVENGKKENAVLMASTPFHGD